MKGINNSKGFSALHALLIVVIVGIVGFTGWYVWHANQNANKTFNAASKNSASQPTVKKKPATESDARYKIEELHLAISLNSNTADLVSKVDGNIVAFSLKGFLNKANTGGYSYVDPEGINSCERLVTIKILKNAAEVRELPTEVTGELIDSAGNPIEKRIIRLDDGRYALPSTNQAPCNSDTSFDGSELQEEDVAARQNILEVLQSSLQSY